MINKSQICKCSEHLNLHSCRVPETMPLYDILNEFQKGHSHMAVVVRQKNDMDKPAATIPDNGKLMTFIVWP